MTLATPIVLLALPLLALLFAPRILGRRHATVMAADGEPLRAAARPSWRIRLRWLPTLLRALAVVLLVLALARPREGVIATSLPEEGIDIVAAVDVSSSMGTFIGSGPSRGTARPQSRLEAAREVLGDFVRSLEGDRVGLVIFQSRALTLSPLTNDLDAIQSRVRSIVSGLIEDGTAIGLGLAESLVLLEDSPARSRVVVLLTDGQNNSGEIAPMTAARVAEALGVRVYTIGFGGGPFDDLDRRGLTQLAETTGGKFYDARTADQLAEAYEDIGSLERSRIGERRFLAYREFAPLLAVAAVLILALEVILRATWLRRLP